MHDERIHQMTQPGLTRYTGTRRGRALLGAASTVALLAALPSTLAMAQDVPAYNLYGSPGLVDMPTAGPAPDATLATTLSHFGDTTRATLNFQITPRLSGSFRYSAIDNFPAPGNVNGRYFDRSFDLRYELLTETQNRPAIAVGLQDFIGTGLYGGEYIVASKEVVPGLRVTGGLGWGRLGSHGAFGNTGNRPKELLGQGGLPTYDRWFRGDVAAFGGVSYSPNRNLTFKLEYSSDDYVQEGTTGQFRKESPWNFGIDYRFQNGNQLSLYHVYGTEVGAQFTIFANPKQAQVPGGSETAPVPVAARSAAATRDLGWTSDMVSTSTSAKAALKSALDTEGLTFEGLKLEPRRATLRLRNNRYGATPQAIGRTARVMSRVLPGSVEEFVIVPVVNGMPMSAVSIQRRDLESLENEAATEMLARTRILDGYRMAPAPEAGLYPRFTWAFNPYVAVSVFDPDSPVRADTGVRLKADYRITPNVVLSGSVTKKIGGNLDDVTRNDPSGLPRVRTDYAKYSKEGDPALEHLTIAAYGRPGKDLYSRLTLGYLEEMYAGVSGELLWKPVDSPLALGVELNYVKQRDFDQRLGLQDYEVLTGHASAYYDFGNGFHGTLDVGRYLAGDYGATVALDREFANGWRVGAYATVTDVSYDDFGEGSFDKGIRISVPLGWVLGEPSRQVNNAEIRSLTRDGGARLNVGGRLYGQVRDYHRPEMAKTWGRFWR